MTYTYTCQYCKKVITSKSLFLYAIKTQLHNCSLYYRFVYDWSELERDKKKFIKKHFDTACSLDFGILYIRCRICKQRMFKGLCNVPGQSYIDHIMDKHIKKEVT